jgi:hypothetical protein
MHPTVEGRRQGEKDKVGVSPQQQALASDTRTLGPVNCGCLHGEPCGWLDDMICGDQCQETASNIARRCNDPAQLDDDGFVPVFCSRWLCLQAMHTELYNPWGLVGAGGEAGIRNANR